MYTYRYLYIMCIYIYIYISLLYCYITLEIYTYNLRFFRHRRSHEIFTRCSLLAHVDVHVQCRCYRSKQTRTDLLKLYFLSFSSLIFFFFFNFEAFNWELFRSFYTVIYLLRFNMYNIYDYLINHRTNIIVKTAI